MFILMLFFVALLGAVVGSYLNVLIWRTKYTSSDFKKRSVCFSCHKKLKLKNLVPVCSFLLQKGKTSCCNKKMPRQYIYVELIHMIAYIVVFLFFGLSSYIVLVVYPAITILVLLASYDVLYGEIPHKWSFAMAAYLLCIYFLLKIPIGNYVFASLIGGGFFVFQIIISKGRWVGGGDVGLGMLMGVILGWPLIIVGLFLSYIIGAVHVLLLLALNKKKFGQTVPFGGYLVMGTMVTLFFGEALFHWYMTLAGF